MRNLDWLIDILSNTELKTDVIERKTDADCCMIVAIGWLADRPNYRDHVYLSGLVALLVSTLVFAFGRNIWLLLASRAIQAMSSAVVNIVGTAIVSDKAGPYREGEVMGHLSVAMTLGFLAGPAISGIVYDVLGYYMVFGVMSIFLAIDIVLRCAMKSSPPDPSNQKSCSGIGTVEEEGDEGHRTGQVETSYETTETSFLLPGKHKSNFEAFIATFRLLFSNRRLLSALYTMFNIVLLFGALEATLPLFLKTRLNATPSLISVFFVALTFPTLFSSLIGRLSDRYGGRWIMAIGLLVASPALVCLRFITNMEKSSVVLLVVMLIIIGGALSLLVTPSMAEISIAAGEMERETVGEKSKMAARAFATMNVVMALGSTISALASGLLIERWGWSTMTAVLGVISAISSVVIAFFAPSSTRSLDVSNDERAGESED